MHILDIDSRTMKSKSQIILDAVEAGELTDPGAMTTTRDVVNVVQYSDRTVEEELHALEADGTLESTTFGGTVVWKVTADADGRAETSTDEPMPTTTRV